MEVDSFQEIKREEKYPSFEKELSAEGREMLNLFIEMKSDSQFREFERWLLKRGEKFSLKSSLS